MHYTLCDQIADIVQNSMEAGATEIQVELVENEKVAVVYVRDNGPGFEYKPLYTNGLKHPHRTTGLGLAFLAQTVEQTDGSWKIDSSENGTTVQMEFNLTHIDTPPIGDVPLLFRDLLVQHSGKESLLLTVHRMKEADNVRKEYFFTNVQLAEAIGDIQTAGGLALLETFLRNQECE